MPHTSMDKKFRKLSVAPVSTKTEFLADFNQRTRMKLRNRHKLEAKNPFKPSQVNKILEDIITQGVSQFYYNHQEASQLCQELASQIRLKVKSLNYDRCKLICVVDIVQKNLQGIRSICSFLWDPKRDHYATYSYNKFDLLATAYVFGIYHD